MWHLLRLASPTCLVRLKLPGVCCLRKQGGATCFCVPHVGGGVLAAGDDERAARRHGAAQVLPEVERAVVALHHRVPGNSNTTHGSVNIIYKVETRPKQKAAHVLPLAHTPPPQSE